MPRTNGITFKTFISDGKFWEPDNLYIKDPVIYVNGARFPDGRSFLEIPDQASVRIAGGVIMSRDAISSSPMEFKSLGYAFRRWHSERNTVYIVVRSKRHNADSIINAVKSAGGEVVRPIIIQK